MPNNTDFCTRAASVSAKNGANGPSTIDEAARTVGVTLATENPVPVWDWDHGRVNEILLMSGAQFPAQVPLLDSHARWSVTNQMGSLRAMQVSGAELRATACFAADDASVAAFSKVRDGHLTDISVGYNCDDVLFIAEGETTSIDGKEYTGPVRLVRQWTVKEGSMTPIGADELAKVRSAMSAAQNNTPEALMADIKDNTQQRGAASGQPLPGASATTVQTAEAGQRAEISPTPAGAPLPQEQPVTSMPSGAGDSSRAALAEMVNIGMRHGCVALAETYIREGRTVDAFRAAVLDRVAQQTERNAPQHNVAVGESDEQRFRAAAADAILLRTTRGQKIETPAEGARELRVYSLRELARECLRRSGISTGGDVMEMIGRSFTSTGDFPAILGDAARRSVLLGAQEANETFPLWTGTASAVDFREHSGISLDAFSSLDETPEGAEITHAQTSDRSVSYRVATYGKIFTLTRRAIVDDDLNLLSEAPAKMGRAAARTVGNKVFDLLFNNPQLKDGDNLFSAARNNLAAAGGAPGYATFKAANIAMGTQKTAQGDALNLVPKYWLVPVAYYTDAAELITSATIGTGDKPNVKNPFYGTVNVIPDGRIDIKGSSAWWVMADKGYSINVAYLNGNQTPRVEQRNAWNVEGVEMKVCIDAGAFVADPRGLYKNPGA